MMRLFYFLFLLVCAITTIQSKEPAKDEFCLTYVHIGEKFPSYLTTAISQARLFNSHCPIYLIGNSEAFTDFNCSSFNITPVLIESLKPSDNHIKFNTCVKNTGYWRVTIERFMYIDDFMQQYGLRNVFHTENDVMLYIDLHSKLGVFEECYRGMLAAVFDCDTRCVPSFVYIADAHVSNKLSAFIADRAHLDTNDMELLCLFKNSYYKNFSDHLPILIPSYATEHPLTNLFHRTAASPIPFYNHLDKLHFIFDAAALGQYLGGIDPILRSDNKPGFLGEESVFCPIFFRFDWEQDTQGRWVPFISYKSERYPIANLHIHCKDLKVFHSLNREYYPLPTEVWSSVPFDPK